MAGRSSVATLEKMEIRTIGDLAQMDVRLVELHLKSHGRKLWEFANGIDGSQVEAERAEAKGIGNSTTLAQDVVTEEEASNVLYLSLIHIFPHAHSPGRMRERSCVRYLIRGAPSFTRVVMTTSPSSPSGNGSKVTGSIISI